MLSEHERNANGARVPHINKAPLSTCHRQTSNTHQEGKFISNRMVGEGLIEEMKLELGLKICDWAKINSEKGKGHWGTPN